ncbi:hypothetical protein [Escherichia phage P817]|nr:hypothetical protein [Escherichia phage P817]
MNKLTHDECISIIRIAEILESGSDDGAALADLLDDKMCLDDIMRAAKKIKEYNFG